MMKYGAAFWGGVVGALVLTILTAVARSVGLPIDFELMLGTLVGLPPGAGAWLLGFLIHLVAGGALGVLYGVGFEALHRGGALMGAGFGLVHGLVAGLVLGMVPAMHPLMPGLLPAPGTFLSSLGTPGVAAVFVLHLVFGAIVGAMYGPVPACGAEIPVEAGRPRRAA